MFTKRDQETIRSIMENEYSSIENNIREENETTTAKEKVRASADIEKERPI